MDKKKTIINTHKVEVTPGIGIGPGKLLVKGSECSKESFAHMYQGEELETRWGAMIEKGMVVPLVKESK